MFSVPLKRSFVHTTTHNRTAIDTVIYSAQLSSISLVASLPLVSTHGHYVTMTSWRLRLERHNSVCSQFRAWREQIFGGRVRVCCRSPRVSKLNLSYQSWRVCLRGWRQREQQQQQTLSTFMVGCRTCPRAGKYFIEKFFGERQKIQLFYDLEFWDVRYVYHEFYLSLNVATCLDWKLLSHLKFIIQG